MTQPVLLDGPLVWQQVAAVAEGAPLVLTDEARSRIRAARLLVESIVRQGVRAYGVNTGVGALCDVVVDEAKQATLSRNIVMSHAVGSGLRARGSAGAGHHRCRRQQLCARLLRSPALGGRGAAGAARS